MLDMVQSMAGLNFCSTGIIHFVILQSTRDLCGSPEIVEMRKSIVLVITTLLFGTLPLTSCWTPAVSPDQVVSMNYDDLKDSKIVTITGKVEILSDGTPTLVEKWESKSRISYTIIGDMGKQIIAKVGEILTVEGIILSMTSPWGGKLVIITVHQ